MEKPAETQTPEALMRQAASLLSNGQPRQALRLAEEALTLLPENAAFCNFAGVCAATAGEHAQAERYWRQSLAINPDDARAHYNLGLLYANGKRENEAEQCYRKAIELDPGDATTHCNLGALLTGMQRRDEAEHHYRRAIALDPRNALAFSNLGALLADQGRYGEAEQYYRQAIAVDPQHVMAHTNLGIALDRDGRYGEAERHYRQAIALNPRNAMARLNLGHLLLLQGRYDEGWREYEARYSPDLPEQDRFPYPDKAPFPPWRGEALTGKSLLVWPEQGFGDEIQFCRYLPLLKHQGAARITLACKPPLKALMETLDGVDAVLTDDEAALSVARHDYWTYPLSIPLYCKTTLESIPHRLPYLRAPSGHIARWAARLPIDGFRVGLVWKGSDIHKNDSHRSLPNLATLAPLWDVPGVRFISLQKGRGEDEARTPPAGQALLDLGREIGDFADTAAIIEQLHLVICVDTAVAHLAGALAKPCWVLLPAEKCDWRWLNDRNDSPWYPGVIRLFRQRQGEDWAPIVQDLKNALIDAQAKHGGRA